MGSLAIRAGGNLEINGSINDGFAPPPVTPDDSGWLLLSGVQPYRGDLVVPDIGVSLAQGTTFPSGALLNFELPCRRRGSRRAPCCRWRAPWRSR